MEIEMESDRQLFIEIDIEDCRQHKSLHSSISKSEFKYHHTKAEPSRNRIVNKRRHGDFRQEPKDANECCNDSSHSPSFVSGEGGLTEVVKLKLNFGKKVIHEGFYVVEQSLTKKSEDRINKEAWKEKKSVGHENSEYRLRGEVGKTKQVKGNKGGKENSKSVKKIEIEEMWKAIAGDSEDEIAEQRTIEDDVFIDDTGVDPHYYILTDDDAFIHNAPQAEEGEEDEEIDLFKYRKKKKKGLVRSPEETALTIEQFLTKFEIAAEEDAEFNRQSRPAINKLKMLPLLRKALSKKHLQQEFLDRDYVVRPQSRIDPDKIRARSNRQKRWAKLDKKLNNLKARKKKRLQAAKISVEGRGLVKYL